MTLNKKKLAFALATLVIILFHINNIFKENKYNIEADEQQYVAYAFNLAKYNIFDHSTTTNTRPTTYREPAYSFFLSIPLRFLPLDNISSVECFTKKKGECHIKYIKYFKIYNLFLVLLTGVYLYLISKKFIHHELAPSFVFFSFLLNPMIFEMEIHFIRENLAILILTMFSFYFQKLLSKHSITCIIISGVLLSILTLTIAIFFHFIIILIVFCFIFLKFTKSKIYEEKIRNTLCTLMISIIIISPYLIRNLNIDNFLGISSRGPDVFKQRIELLDFKNEDYHKIILTNLGFKSYDSKNINKFLIRNRGDESYYRIAYTNKGFLNKYMNENNIHINNNSKLNVSLKLLLFKKIHKNLLIIPIVLSNLVLENRFVGYEKLFLKYIFILSDILFLIVNIILIPYLIRIVFKKDVRVITFAPFIFYYCFYVFFTHLEPRYMWPLIPFYVLVFYDAYFKLFKKN